MCEERDSRTDATFSEVRARMRCCVCADNRGDMIRCLDCGPEVIRCIDCTLSHHKDCHLLHKPELLLETGPCPFHLRSCFVRPNHQCATLHTRTLHVFDGNGRSHDCWFKPCDCESDRVALLRWSLWPSSPTRPRLAFHLDFLRWFASLLFPGRLSLRSACRVVSQQNALTPYEAGTLYQHLANGCFDAYQRFRTRCDSLGTPTNGIVIMTSTENSGDVTEVVPGISYLECNEFSDNDDDDNTTEVNCHVTCSDPSTSYDETHHGRRAVLPSAVTRAKRPRPNETALAESSDEQAEVRSSVPLTDPGVWSDSPCQTTDPESDAKPVAGESDSDDSNGRRLPRPLGEGSGKRIAQGSLLSALTGVPNPQPALDKVVVLSTTNEDGIRNWDKKQYCLYCGEPFAKVTRHLEIRHRYEPDVALLRKTQCPKARKQLMRRLLNLGNHLHNRTVLQRGRGALIVVRRPSGGSVVRGAQEYSPCPSCYGYYINGDLLRHSCPAKNLAIDFIRQRSSTDVVKR